MKKNHRNAPASLRDDCGENRGTLLYKKYTAKNCGDFYRSISGEIFIIGTLTPFSAKNRISYIHSPHSKQLLQF